MKPFICPPALEIPAFVKEDDRYNLKQMKTRKDGDTSCP